MAYTIRYSDPVKDPILVPNNTVLPAGTELDLTLYGKGKLDYGQEWDTNFLHLLENFANGEEPDAPTEGQQWFDTSGSPKANLLKYRLEDGSWATTASETYVNAQIGALLGSPAGLGPLPWSGSAAPDGWLLCKGDTVSRTTYSALFGAIGTTFNTGGEAGTDFRLPDMRGRFPLGLNDGIGSQTNKVNRAEAISVGGVDGVENVTLTENQIPNHDHTATMSGTDGDHDHLGGTTSYTGDHTHTVEYSAHQGLEGKSSGGHYPSYLNGSGLFDTTSLSSIGDHQHTVTIPQNSSSNHTHNVTIGFKGGSSLHDNTPPFLTIQYIIKT